MSTFFSLDSEGGGLFSLSLPGGSPSERSSLPPLAYRSRKLLTRFASAVGAQCLFFSDSPPFHRQELSSWLFFETIPSPPRAASPEGPAAGFPSCPTTFFSGKGAFALDGSFRSAGLLRRFFFWACSPQAVPPEVSPGGRLSPKEFRLALVQGTACLASNCRASCPEGRTPPLKPIPCAAPDPPSQPARRRGTSCLRTLLDAARAFPTPPKPGPLPWISSLFLLPLFLLLIPLGKWSVTVFSSPFVVSFFRGQAGPLFFFPAWFQFPSRLL